MKDSGKVYRDGDQVIVEAVGMNDVRGLPGVICVNPDAPADDQRWRKVFKRKPIYLPSEYERATVECLHGTDVVVIGMNGYSRLTDQQCAAWGVRPGAYEAACHAILRSLTLELQRSFPGIDVRFAHGASNLGVDRSIIAVGHELNRPMLGHSCPRFMFYVEDDDDAVYVADTQEEYADSFIRSLDVLIAANGRLQAFKHDLNAAFLHLRHVIPVNVLRSISTIGGPPAIGPDGKIEDAVAAFEDRVHTFSVELGRRDRDPWRNLVRHVRETVVHISRQLLSPSRAFAVPT